MGTGVGEAALAAELAGAGAATGAGLGAAGIAEAGLLGGEVAGGLGAAGAGLGATGAGLGATAGGLGSLAPAFQQAVSGTAAVMPDVAAQTAQFANIGAMPPANATLGAGQIGDPVLARSLTNPAVTSFTAQEAGIPGLDTGLDKDVLEKTAAPLTEPANAANSADMAQRAQFADAYTKHPDLYPGKLTPGGSTVFYPSGEAKFSFGNAPDTVSMIEARGATAIPSASQAAGAAFDPTTMSTINQGAGDIAAGQKGFSNPFSALKSWYDKQDDLTKGVVKYGGMGLGALGAAKYLNKNPSVAPAEKYSGPLSKFSYDPSTYTPYTYKPYAAGGPVEAMSNQNSIGANTGYPQANIQHGAYATPWQSPVSRNVVADAGDTGVDQMTGLERMAGGGIANLGSYSDGGRLLKGPGDGMSDNIPANISGKQPARLADGEFVVPADVVSGLGNGSTDAGAKQLYKMLDKVRSARTGTKKQGKQINPNKYTPA